jgi:hypothetical protein
MLSIVSTEAEILRRCDVDETKATELRKRRFSEDSSRSGIAGKDEVHCPRVK